MKKKIYINGYFVKEHINGVPRYAAEIIKRIDRLFEPGEVVLVVPKGAVSLPQLKNIEISTWEDRGCRRENETVLWGERTYNKYIRDKAYLNVNLTNRGESFDNSITTIHDLILMENYRFDSEMFWKPMPKYYIHEAIDKLWFCHKMKLKKKHSMRIVTVSEESKKRISEKLLIPTEKISVIGNGWEHVLEIIPEDERRDARIEKGSYLFSIGNIKPHKNFQWVLNEARALPKEVFVIAGKIHHSIADAIRTNYTNVVLLGHISDGYMRFLMENAKALLFPSIDEGFGIPPLEALALGTPAIVSDIPVMHEIYKNSVYYVNPNDGGIDLNSVLEGSLEKPDELLQEHTWEKAAREWYSLICKEINP